MAELVTLSEFLMEKNTDKYSVIGLIDTPEIVEELHHQFAGRDGLSPIPQLSNNNASPSMQTGELYPLLRVLRGHKMSTQESFFDEVSAALQFPPHFGQTWDGFYDLLTDLEWLAPASAIIFLIISPEDVLSQEPHKRNILLEIFTDVCTFWKEPRIYVSQPLPFRLLMHHDIRKDSQRCLDWPAEMLAPLGIPQWLNCDEWIEYRKDINKGSSSLTTELHREEPFNRRV